MLHYQRVQREDAEVVQITCNKCGRHWLKSENHPDITAIKNTYGFGSKKDGNKYVSHICEPCMDEFYATFAVRPQVVSPIIWGEEVDDPVRYLAYPEAERLLRELSTEMEKGLIEDPEYGTTYADNLREQLDFYLRDCTPAELEALSKLSATLYGSPSTAAPVAPAVEDHEPQEEAP